MPFEALANNDIKSLKEQLGGMTIEAKQILIKGAIEYNNLEAIESIIESDNEILNISEILDYIKNAISGGNDNLADLLITQLKDEALKGEPGNKILLAAAMSGNINAFDKAITKGADIHFKKPLIHQAIDKKADEQVLKFLIEKGCDVNQLDDRKQL